jgi:hypothetical protein
MAVLTSIHKFLGESGLLHFSIASALTTVFVFSEVCLLGYNAM